jgi:uncharacterized low-complexity protein
MNTKTRIALAIGSAIVAGSALAAPSPFTLNVLDSGYQLAEAGAKQKDGKCGEAKCGANKKAKDASCGANKAKEASCGAEKKMKEASCGGNKKLEATCGANKKS